MSQIKNNYLREWTDNKIHQDLQHINGDGGSVEIVLSYLREVLHIKLSDQTVREIGRVRSYRSELLNAYPELDKRVKDLRTSGKVLRVHTDQGVFDFSEAVSYAAPSLFDDLD